MSAEELKAALSTPAALFALMLLASVGSAWKQMLVARRGGSFVSVQSYFLDNWPETLAMIGHNVIAFVMLIFTDTLNPAAAIGLGYIANDAADAYTKQGRSFSIGSNDPYADGSQKGFARISLLVMLAAVSAIILSACATNPDGARKLTPEGQAILETSARIAVRHFVADSPRTVERVENLREVVVKLQQLTSAETTLGALKAVVVLEVERLNLDPVDRSDALDLLDLFATALEARLGQDPLQAAGLVRVNEFLDLVLAAIPEAQPPAGEVK